MWIALWTRGKHEGIMMKGINIKIIKASNWLLKVALIVFDYTVLLNNDAKGGSKQREAIVIISMWWATTFRLMWEIYVVTWDLLGNPFSATHSLLYNLMCTSQETWLHVEPVKTELCRPRRHGTGLKGFPVKFRRRFPAEVLGLNHTNLETALQPSSNHWSLDWLSTACWKLLMVAKTFLNRKPPCVCFGC